MTRPASRTRPSPARRSTPRPTTGMHGTAPRTASAYRPFAAAISRCPARRTPLATSSSITSPSRISPTAPAKWADTIAAEIDAATLAGDTARLHAAESMAERVATAFPNDGLILHYQAYALYRAQA